MGRDRESIRHGRVVEQELEAEFNDVGARLFRTARQTSLDHALLLIGYKR